MVPSGSGTLLGPLDPQDESIGVVQNLTTSYQSTRRNTSKERTLQLPDSLTKILKQQQLKWGLLNTAIKSPTRILIRVKKFFFLFRDILFIEENSESLMKTCHGHFLTHPYLFMFQYHSHLKSY
jgi:hypothetical protein